MRNVRKYVAVFAAVTALLVVAMEIYTRQPVSAVVPALDLPPDLSTLVLVIHGSGDEDNPQLAEIVAGLDSRYRNMPGTAVRFVRWAPASDQRLRAAATAQGIGRALGAMLGEIQSLHELHLIAHSSGAFMPDAICSSWRAASRNPVHVAMVLLDPFQIRGFVDWSYGAREHGRCADFALAVINTEDPAPATSQMLDKAYNLDVTHHPERASFVTRNGHYWPLQYYRDHLLDVQPDMNSRQHASAPRGAGEQGR